MKNVKTDKTGALLLLGIGNNGRRDDGLGWRFTDMATGLRDPGLDCEYRYQLQVEDVLPVCRHKKILFVDATHEELREGYVLRPCRAAPHYYYSSHMQSPETILYLARELYHQEPEAWVLAISGKNWGLGTKLSREAEDNLAKAFRYFQSEWLKGNLQQEGTVTGKS